MKIKLKEFNFDFIEWIGQPVKIPGSGSIMNFKYLNEILEFQTPVSSIEQINENGLLLKLAKQCNSFLLKIKEFETFIEKKYKCVIKSPLDGDTFILKLKQIPKVYNENGLVNYYHLKENDKIICLVSLDKLWINNQVISYCLTLKEIKIC